MRFLRLKINFILVSSIIFIVCIIISFDTYSLNSLLINYDDSFVINYVNIGKNSDEKTSEDSSNLSNSNVALVNNVANLNNWVFPVGGSYLITTYYGYDHRAIDIYSYNGMGSPIVSANNGTVVKVAGGCVSGNLNCNGRGGNYVVINHNNGNYYTVYMHLKDIYVSVGDSVGADQVIGTMGNTGYVIPAPTSSNPYGGTHLHFCVYIGDPDRGGYAVNPFDLY